MATRDYRTYYSTPGLWEIPDPTHNDIDAAVGVGSGLNANDTLVEVIEWNASSPAVIAIVTDDEPEHVQYAHRPRKFRGGGNLQDQVVWTIGNTEDDVEFIVLPNTLFASTNNITILADSAAIVTALAAAGTTHDGPHAAGDPNTVNVRIRKASLQPVTWGQRQVAGGPDTFAEYHASYIAPVLATGDANAINDIQPHINWWSAQATASPPGAGGGANRYLGRVAPVPVAPADRGTLMAFGRRRIVIPDMNQLAAPAGPGHLTNAGITAAIGVLDTTLRQHETERANREHDVANKSFTDRHGDFKAELMHRMMEVADDASLPQVHRSLARTDKNERHKAVIQAGLAQAIAVSPLPITPTNSVVVSNQMVSWFRTHEIGSTGLVFGEGMNPFAVVVLGHPNEREARRDLEDAQRVEMGGHVSLADARVIATSNALLPVMMTHVIDKLYNFSIVLDIYFGPTHVLARAYRNMAVRAGPALNGLMSYYDSGRQALQIALRFLYSCQQLVFQWIRKRQLELNAATRIPAPDFDAMVECILTFMMGTLPQLPASWERLIIDNADAPGPARIRGGGGGGAPAGTSTVRPARHSEALRQRWRNTGFQRTSELQAGWTGEGSYRDGIPKFGDGVTVCLNWAIKGVCDSGCRREAAHRDSDGAMVNKLMKFMDHCGVTRN